MSKPLISVIEGNIYISYKISHMHIWAEQILQAWVQQRFIHCKSLKNVLLQLLSLQVDSFSHIRNSLSLCKS